MMKVYLGKLIPLGGRPKHFEEAELKCGEGPFVGPPSGWQPNVERDFNIEEEE
jgi:hypothetical protein